MLQLSGFPEFPRVCEKFNCGSKCIVKGLQRATARLDFFFQNDFLIFQFLDAALVSLDDGIPVSIDKPIKKLLDLLFDGNQLCLNMTRPCLA